MLESSTNGVKGLLTALASAPRNVMEVLAGHVASGVHRKVYEHRELLPMSLLRDGLERLRYEEVVDALRQG